MKFDIVVAHYNENIQWIRSLDHEDISNIFVYTKSTRDPKIDDFDKVCHSYLTNVGRESHTYIWHCVHNYEQIASGEWSDFTFFVQGSPHGLDSRSIINWINVISNEKLDYTHNFRISSPYDFLDNGRCKHWAGETKPADCDVREWCEKHVRKNAKFMMPIFWNACFGVSNRLISLSDKSRYVNLIQNELSCLNPECGHYCERLWYYIFNMDESQSKSPKDSYDFWGGYDGNRHYGMLKLNDDGTIGMYNHYNESFWTSSGDSITFYDLNKNPTCVMNKTKEGNYEGKFLGDGRTIHRLSSRKNGDSLS